MCAAVATLRTSSVNEQGQCFLFPPLTIIMAAFGANDDAVTIRALVLPRFSSVFFRFFIGFFVVENAVIDMKTEVMMENIAPLHIFQIKKDSFKSMQPILRYSKNNKQLF